jgi:GNAT superfamily N-acetyltransferase
MASAGILRALSDPVQIRPATPADVPLILSLVRELAHYERAADQVLGTEAQLHDGLFGEDHVAETVIAEVDGQAAGFALFFPTFSTWLCRPGLWLEDLYVSPTHRRGGVGQALLVHLAKLAVARGYGRVEWSVLDWNKPAIDFYVSLGAAPLDDWTVFRLAGQQLRSVARQGA